MTTVFGEGPFQNIVQFHIGDQGPGQGEQEFAGIADVCFWEERTPPADFATGWCPSEIGAEAFCPTGEEQITPIGVYRLYPGKYLTHRNFPISLLTTGGAVIETIGASPCPTIDFWAAGAAVFLAQSSRCSYLELSARS